VKLYNDLKVESATWYNSSANIRSIAQPVYVIFVCLFVAERHISTI